MKNNKNMVIIVVLIIIVIVSLLLWSHKKANAPTDTGEPPTTDGTDVKKTPPKTNFKIEPADPSKASTEASIKADTRTITGERFSFVVPYAWNYSLQKVNGCEDMTVTKTKQTGEVDIMGQIDIWPTDCLPDYVSYQKEAQVGAYTIQVSNAEDWRVQTGETAAVYNQILSTFKMKPDRPIQ